VALLAATTAGFRLAVFYFTGLTVSDLGELLIYRSTLLQEKRDGLLA
jgi:hypothetical protein